MNSSAPVFIRLKQNPQTYENRVPWPNPFVKVIVTNEGKHLISNQVTYRPKDDIF